MQCVKKAFSEKGINIPEEVLLKLCGVPGRDNPKVIREYIKEEFDDDEILRMQRGYFNQWLMEGKIKVKLGLFELISWIESKGIKKAIATGRSRKPTEIILNKTKIIKHFNIIVTCDDYINGKPNPDAFLKTSELLQMTPEECLVLEDSNYRN